MAVTYYALLTTIGAGKLANATALGTTLKITQLAVGDGGGNVPTPDASRTQLVNEVRRAPLNRLSIDPANSAQIIAEQVIPEDVGGWWIREMGLYDEAGALIAYANCAPSYKPQLAEGSGRTQTVRIVLIVSNAASVELKIDPSVVLATREYVDSAIVSAMNRLDCKQSVRVATTASVTLIGLQTLDGIALTAGDRVLVKNQSNAVDNGIYVAATTAWKRSTDADENSEVTPGLTVVVESGTSQADSIWQLVTDGAIVLGTTALTFQNITNGLAKLASPAFTGVPTAPTAPTGTSSQQLATTGFVQSALTPFAPLVSPGLQGVPTAPTANSGENSAQLATTAFVQAVTLPLAAKASPAFTGTPTAPTAVLGNNTQQLSTTAFVQASIASLAAKASPAFSGTPTAPTPQQFDVSQRLATTEFVKQAMGSCSGFLPVSVNTTLTPSQVGYLVTSNVGTGSVSVALPLISSVPIGAQFVVTHSSGSMTSFGLVTSGSDALVMEGLGGNLNPYGMTINECLTVVSTGASWKIVTGNGARFLKAGGGFGAGLSANGYQRLPSGVILQWGTATTGSDGVGTLVFPIAFPNICCSVQLTGWTAGSSAGGIASLGTSTKTGATVYGMMVSPSSGTGAISLTMHWLAIGF